MPKMRESVDAPPRRARARAVLVEKRESLANLVYFGRVGLELAAS